MKYRIFLFLFIIFVTLSCKQEPVRMPVVSDITPYAGLEIDRTIIYRIDSTIFNYSGGSNNVKTERSSFIREIVSDSIYVDGQIRYRIEQEHSNSSGGPWIINKTFQAYYDGEKYVRIEENLPFIKLVNPIYMETFWNAFSLFNIDSITYNIDGNILKPFNTQNIASVIHMSDTTIEGNMYPFLEIEYQNFDDEILFKTYNREKYAQGIGLINKEYFLGETNSCVIRNGETAECQSLPWTEKATSGIHIIQEMISWE